ncbi:MAG: aromatic amino acid transaminase [Alphaproteobacteria bacterium]
MLENLKTEPPDPILSLIDMLRADKRPGKIDLGVGVYVDEYGRTPVMDAVKRAEKKLHNEQTSKAYVASVGDSGFTAQVRQLVFGAALSQTLGARLAGFQVAGGMAALRLGGEVLKRAGCENVWLGEPTWAIHPPVISASGLAARWYDYFDSATQTLKFDAMMSALSGAKAGEAVLLHACCHNPSGADLDPAQWRALAALMHQRGLIPFIDLAYQGLGDGLEEDASGLRVVLEAAPEAVIAVSESKTFGLYRERTGALFLLAKDEQGARVALSNGLVAARVAYSMPPDHGAAVVRAVLEDDALKRNWQRELDVMRKRIKTLRALLADRAAAAGLNLESVRTQRGMFSMLPLTSAQTLELRAAHGVYMPENGRINIAGISPERVDDLVDKLRQVMTL